MGKVRGHSRWCTGQWGVVRSVVNLEIGGRFFHSLIQVKTLHSVSKYNSAPWVTMVNPSAYWGQERKVAMPNFFVYLLGIRWKGRWAGKDLVMADPIKCCLDMICACVLSCFSCVCLFVTLWTVALQAPLSMGFSSKNTGVSCHFLLQGIFLT